MTFTIFINFFMCCNDQEEVIAEAVTEIGM